MPELPEIITIRNDLRQTVKNKRILRIDSLDNYPLNPGRSHFEKYAVNHSITEINNIAKLLVLNLSSQYYLAIHLKMTGNLLYNNEDKYVKIRLSFTDSSYLNFSDVRKFGYFELWDNSQVDRYKTRYGKQLLESDLTADEFVDLVTKRKAPIKNVILNQAIVSGAGNIYANDALYLARIHPLQPANTIDIKNLKVLYDRLVFVLEQGVKNRGSSIDRYKDVFGKPGTHQDHFYIYGKRGKLCNQCGVSYVETSKVAGRGTFHCPTCQPLV